MELVAERKGSNLLRTSITSHLNPEGVGSMLRTKINVNLGVSRDCKDYDVEMQKVMSAVKLWSGGYHGSYQATADTQPFRQKLTSECPAMIGTVPVYDSVIHYQRDLATLTATGFRRCCKTACRGWRGFRHPSLRNYKKNNRADQKA